MISSVQDVGVVRRQIGVLSADSSENHVERDLLWVLGAIGRFILVVELRSGNKHWMLIPLSGSVWFG